jgi:uncharacterized protein YkwD
MLIDRRSFLIGAPGVALGLTTLTAAQGIVERGRFGEDDLPLAREQLLRLVNEERATAELNTLELDELACRIANEHAVDMASAKFLSHWGRDGRKPYQRYSFAGGTAAVQENVSAAENIASLTPSGVSADLRDMHLHMLAEVSPNDGHRRTILATQHSHVGFGVAFNERSLRLVELYVAKYVQVDPIQRQAERNATIVLTGRLINANHFLHQVDIFCEPLPTPADADWRTPRPYSLPDVYVTLRPKAPEGTRYTDGGTGDYEWGRSGKFRVPAKLFKDAPGIYTIVFWIRTVPAEKAFPATQICIRGE